ncbi:hypothetical protein PV328_004216, partial [Microctonus aethiopoides]
VTMNVIIQTGFEAISHNISFHPQTMNKGKLLVTADHVRDVEEFRQCGKSHLIKSKVIRQASITLFPYDTNLHISVEEKSRIILDTNMRTKTILVFRLGISTYFWEYGGLPL